MSCGSGNSNFSVAIHLRIFPLCCVFSVWIFNSHVHNISTALIPCSSAESVIHYGGLIWDTCHTRRGWGNKDKLTWDSVSCHTLLERGAWACPNGYTQVSRPTPWLLRSKHYKNYGYTHTQYQSHKKHCYYYT